MEKYVPDAYKESIHQVNYDLLYSKGITCLLFDLDNTLVSPNAKTPTEEVKKLLNNLKEKFEVIIFSNGQKKKSERIYYRFRY